MNQSDFNGLLAAVAVTTVLLNPINATAAVDMFLKIDGVTGESADSKHKGEIDVLAWSWGETSTATSQAASGGVGAAKPMRCITDLSITKYIDVATPKLITNGITNSGFSSAKLTIRKAGDSPIEFFTIKMADVTISSYQTGGSGGEDRLTETITLHFNTAQGEYVPQDPSGRAGDPVTWQVSETRGRGAQACP